MTALVQPRWRRSERGSVVVEYLGVLPLIFAVALIVLQGLTAIAVATSAQDAARIAARAAAEGASAAEVRRAAEYSLPGWLDDNIAALDVLPAGDEVTVSIEMTVPGVGSVADDVAVTREATFERE